MADNYEIYYIYDDPVPFGDPIDKNVSADDVVYDFYIYPVRMRKYLQFLTVAQVLLLDKNSVPDAKIISMSYLEYVIHEATDENYYGAFLNMLLHLIFDLDDKVNIFFFSDEKGMPCFKVGNKDKIFTRHDFAKIRDIIIEQNLLSPPDDFIQKDLRDKMEEAEQLRRKIGGNKVAGIEDQMVSLAIATGFSMENIYDMTIRKFSKSLERVDLKLHYEMEQQASMSGFVAFKKQPKHWLSEIKKDRLAGLMGYDEFENKVGSTTK